MPHAIQTTHTTRTATTETKTQSAIRRHRAVFSNRVKSAADLLPSEDVIKKSSNAKLGRRISKGRWKGMPLFTVTLEERATCPISCQHWKDCYGNHLHLATRYDADENLIPRIKLELAQLAAKYPNGFSIRLHVLGDFYSTEYVAMWADALNTYPNLHVWGYTARIDTGDDISDALSAIDNPRWQVRNSGLAGDMGALSEDHPDIPATAFVCPQQTAKTKECGTCGACWSTTRSVVFLNH